jgi:hypothetical protein
MILWLWNCTLERPTNNPRTCLSLPWWWNFLGPSSSGSSPSTSSAIVAATRTYGWSCSSWQSRRCWGLRPALRPSLSQRMSVDCTSNYARRLEGAPAPCRNDHALATLFLSHELLGALARGSPLGGDLSDSRRGLIQWFSTPRCPARDGTRPTTSCFSPGKNLRALNTTTVKIFSY